MTIAERSVKEIIFIPIGTPEMKSKIKPFKAPNITPNLCGIKIIQPKFINNKKLGLR